MYHHKNLNTVALMVCVPSQELEYSGVDSMCTSDEELSQELEYSGVDGMCTITRT